MPALHNADHSGCRFWTEEASDFSTNVFWTILLLHLLHPSTWSQAFPIPRTSNLLDLHHRIGTPTSTVQHNGSFQGPHLPHTAGWLSYDLPREFATQNWKQPHLIQSNILKKAHFTEQGAKPAGPLHHATHDCFLSCCSDWCPKALIGRDPPPTPSAHGSKTSI